MCSEDALAAMAAGAVSQARETTLENLLSWPLNESSSHCTSYCEYERARARDPEAGLNQSITTK